MQRFDSVDPYQPVSMGTTILALKFKGGVVLAMDSKTSAGNFISDRMAIKGNQISPSVVNYGPIFVLRCGNAAASQVVTRYVYNYLTYHAMELGPSGKVDLATVATLYRNICYANKEHLECAFILSNGREIYEVDSSGALFKPDLLSTLGSGSVFCSGYLTYHAKPGMARQEAVDVMVKAVALALDADMSSGGNINVYVVSEGGETEKIMIDHNSAEGICQGLAPVRV